MVGAERAVLLVICCPVSAVLIVAHYTRDLGAPAISAKDIVPLAAANGVHRWGRRPVLLRVVRPQEEAYRGAKYGRGCHGTNCGHVAFARGEDV